MVLLSTTFVTIFSLLPLCFVSNFVFHSFFCLLWFNWALYMISFLFLAYQLYYFFFLLFLHWTNLSVRWIKNKKHNRFHFYFHLLFFVCTSFTFVDPSFWPISFPSPQRTLEKIFLVEHVCWQWIPSVFVCLRKS